MVTATLLAIWSIMLIAPETAIGRVLHRLLVAAPAARLNRITRGQVLLYGGLIAGGSAAFWVGGHDLLRVFVMASPELAGWITAFEITAYIDAIVAIAMAASSLRVRLMGTRLAAFFTRCQPGSARSSRARRTRTIRPPAANDDDRAAVALAA